MAQRLPVEVYERILAYVVHESSLYTYPSDGDKAAYKPFDQELEVVQAPKDLAACSVVCKAWSARAQQKLYRVLIIVNDKRPRSLMPYLLVRPALAQNVRFLAVDCAITGQSITLLVGLLHNLDTYHLQARLALGTNIILPLPTFKNMHLRNFTIRGEIGPVILREHALFRLPDSIVSLTLLHTLLVKDPYFYLPNLQELQIDGKSLDTVKYYTFKGCHAITNVSLVQATGLDSMTLIHSIGRQLTTLKLINPVSTNPVNGMLNSHLPNLSHLEIQGNMIVAGAFTPPRSLRTFSWLEAGNHWAISLVLDRMQELKPCFLPNLVAFPWIYAATEDPEHFEAMQPNIEAAWKSLHARGLPLLPLQTVSTKITGPSVFEWFREKNDLRP